MEIQYAYFAVTERGYPHEPVRELINTFNSEIELDDVVEILRRFRPDIEYDYLVIEKQLHHAYQERE